MLDDEEEVLIVLAESLGGFLEHVGGPQYAVHIMNPLENLSTVEESAVREKVRILVHVITFVRLRRD